MLYTFLPTGRINSDYRKYIGQKCEVRKLSEFERSIYDRSLFHSYEFKFADGKTGFAEKLDGIVKKTIWK